MKDCNCRVDQEVSDQFSSSTTQSLGPRTLGHPRPALHLHTPSSVVLVGQQASLLLIGCSIIGLCNLQVLLSHQIYPSTASPVALWGTDCSKRWVTSYPAGQPNLKALGPRAKPRPLPTCFSFTSWQAGKPPGDRLLQPSPQPAAGNPVIYKFHSTTKFPHPFRPEWLSEARLLLHTVDKD